MIRTNFYYPEQMLARLKSAKERTGLSVSELVRKAVEKFLVEMGL